MFDNLIKKWTKSNVLFYIMVVLFIAFIFKNPDISILFFASLVFACSLMPMVDKLNKRYSRPVATSIVLFGTLGILVCLLLPILVMAAYQVGSFASDFPKYIVDINRVIHTNPFLVRLGIANLNIITVFDTVASFSTNAFNNIIYLIGGLGSAFVYILASVIFIFYFLCDKTAIKKSALLLFPTNMRKKANLIIDITGSRIGGYILGQICAIASVGLVMLIGLVVFKIHYAVILSLITAVLDIIPIIGPTIALIIGLIVTHESGICAMLILACVFAAAQLIENNLVRPYVFGKLLKMHPIIIFLFLFIATKYLGIVGALFAPAIAATVCVLVEELYVKNLD